MGIKTGISWCDATWNPWMGCSPVASGCAHCYARREMTRYGRDFSTVTRAKDATFRLPLKLAPGTRVFVCSWSDFFHPTADAWRMDAWDVMAKRRDLTFIILTKRIDRAVPRLPWVSRSLLNPGGIAQYADAWPHVWGLVSASTQAEVDVVVPQLLAAPFAVRGVSLEPLLERVDLTSLPVPGCDRPFHYDALTDQDDEHYYNDHPKLDWVIVGGESGGPPERALVEKRPCQCGQCRTSFWDPIQRKADWVRSLRDQCQAAGTAFHFKQWGGPRPDSAGRLLDGQEWAWCPARKE